MVVGWRAVCGHVSGVELDEAGVAVELCGEMEWSGGRMTAEESGDGWAVVRCRVEGGTR